MEGEDLNERGLTLKTVLKAVEVLEVLARTPGGGTLKELSQALGQNVSTTYHLLNTLRQSGLLQQNPETKVYRLGLKAFQIGQAAMQHLDLARAAEPIMRALSSETGEGVSLVQYDGGRPVYVSHIDSPRTIGMRLKPGATIPLHCTGSGKVFLSSLPDAELEGALSRLSLDRYTAKTISDPRVLLSEIRRVRQQGYAVDDEEVEEGLVCIAAPIHNHLGEIVGSISLSGPSGRINDRLPELITRTRDSARTTHTIIQKEVSYLA